MRLRCLILAGLTGCFLITNVGCGGKDKLVKVEGVLLWKDTNKPVGGAMVEFIPMDEKSSGQPAFARTEPDGSFMLTTKNPDDGAFPGKYKVKVTKPKDTPGGEGSIPKGPGDKPDMAAMMKKRWAEAEKNRGKLVQDPKDAIPARYTSFESTDLIVTVESGMDKVTLKLRKS
jgi:hypothetical protein